MSEYCCMMAAGGHGCTCHRDNVLHTAQMDAKANGSTQQLTIAADGTLRRTEVRMIPIDVIEQAARRCDDYLLCYGLTAKWELHVLGLRLIAEYGTDKVEKTLFWSDLARSEYPGEDIHNAEKQALSGLSN